MIKNAILAMLKDNTYVSGQTISEKFQISRTAVWKHIKSLKDQGYLIKSKKNKGYQLVNRPDSPLSEEILPILRTSIIGSQYHYFQTISSTNHYAKTLLKNQVPEGTVIVAEQQEKGRGRKQRNWHSPKQGLWFSIILYPPIPPQKAMYVTMTASIAIVKTLSEVCDIHAEIKWPNDILINGKKVCGILTELDAEMDQINYSIIGIGLNVNNDISDELQKIATSLKKEKNKYIKRVHLLCSILENFDQFYEYISNNDLEYIRNTWLDYSNIIGKKISVHGEKETIYGTVTGLDEHGCLLVSEQNKMRHIITGDIEYI